MDKNERHTIKWIAKELEELRMFDAVNLRLSKWEGAEPLRRDFEQQYAKLRRLGSELRKLTNGRD